MDRGRDVSGFRAEHFAHRPQRSNPAWRAKQNRRRGWAAFARCEPGRVQLFSDGMPNTNVATVPISGVSGASLVRGRNSSEVSIKARGRLAKYQVGEGIARFAAINPSAAEQAVKALPLPEDCRAAALLIVRGN
jgi:hypothetical protein